MGRDKLFVQIVATDVLKLMNADTMEYVGSHEQKENRQCIHYSKFHEHDFELYPSNSSWMRSVQTRTRYAKPTL